MSKDISANKTYEVFSATPEFVKKHQNDYENLVALQSKEISLYINTKEGKIPNTIEGIVCVKNASNQSRRIYRKVVASSTYGLDGGHAMLSDRSMNQLGIKEYDKIIICPTNRFCYLWHNYDATISFQFKVAVILGILSLLIGIIPLIITCACCH
ncbi:MAG: hypothetical protein II551_07575, partial [Paludibacteraceae bacterium]|nr:hypothetical protein [Paludibacteraceae bacterium]